MVGLEAGRQVDQLVAKLPVPWRDWDTLARTRLSCLFQERHVVSITETGEMNLGETLLKKVGPKISSVSRVVLKNELSGTTIETQDVVDAFFKGAGLLLRWCEDTIGYQLPFVIVDR